MVQLEILQAPPQPGTPRRTLPRTAALTDARSTGYRLDALVSPRASTVPLPPPLSPLRAPRSPREPPVSLRTWGWHDRNAAAVKNLIQQAVTQALAQDKAMSERAALRNVEVSKASARALEKVKASAVKVAAERDAAEQRALAEHNR